MSNSVADQIREQLSTHLQPNFLSIHDDSNKHKGHAGNTGGGHYHIEISASCFKDKSRIESHRLIYQILDQLIQSKQIHALSIKIN